MVWHAWTAVAFTMVFNTMHIASINCMYTSEANCIEQPYSLGTCFHIDISRLEAKTTLFTLRCTQNKTSAFFLFPFCSDMEFDLKAILPPIKERKTESPDSLAIEGSFFVNKAALEHRDSDSLSYTELRDQPLRRATPPLNDYVASPVSNKSGSLPRRLPPLFLPGHSQENLSDNKNEQTSALWSQ